MIKAIAFDLWETLITDTLDLVRHIDAMVFSNENGVCKPQASIFAALRERLGVEYAETMFVGDNLYVDVHGAQRLGMHAVHFIPPVRGTAVAPHFEHGLEIVPDATIRDSGELLRVIPRRNDREASPAPGDP